MSTEHSDDHTELRNRAELFRFIVESASDYAIFTMDLERRVTSWNAGAERAMGWREGEIIGQTGDTIFIPEDREICAPEKEAQIALSEGRAEDLRWHLRKDGSRFWGDGIMAPLKDDSGNVRGLMKILRDRTVELRAEEARKLADRRKDEFLATLAHELRNPLAAIGNAGQLSLRAETDAKAQRWAKEVIVRQVKHLSVMIDDLLDISRINQGKIQLRKEPLHVGPVIARAMETVSHILEEKRHEVRTSVATGPMRVSADPTRLEQIVTNLVTNSAKYTDPEGLITVSAYPERGNVVISVKDNGIGLTPQMLNEVFDLFAQVDVSLERTRGGLGIGLAVVKRLVEMHGGTVHAASGGLGKGSVFTVRLPTLRENDESIFQGAEKGRDPSASRKVLVVDDEVDAAVGLAKLLAVAGHEVELAHDGNSAIDIAKSIQPDFILIDLSLPGIVADEVLSRIRNEPSLRNSSLVALSGQGQPEDRERSHAAGFDHHLAKPVNFEALLSLISL